MTTNLKLNLAQEALRNLINFNEHVIDLNPSWSKNVLLSTAEFESLLNTEIGILQHRKNKEECGGKKYSCKVCGCFFFSNHFPHNCEHCGELYGF